MIAALLAHDLARFALGRGGRGGPVLPVLFFVAVAMLYPFAVGPDPALLARSGGGVVWVAALLAALLPVESLVRPDVESGFFDQLVVRGVADEAAMAVRVVAHWAGFGPPLMLATLPAAALVGLPGGQLATVELGLLLGTPGLAAIGVLVAALTASLRGGAALAGLIGLPLAIPLLVFGAGSLAPGGESGLWLLAAASLALVALVPFAAGAAVRAVRD